MRTQSYRAVGWQGDPLPLPRKNPSTTRRTKQPAPELLILVRIDTPRGVAVVLARGLDQVEAARMIERLSCHGQSGPLCAIDESGCMVLSDSDALMSDAEFELV